MTTVTTIQCSPDEFSRLITDELLRQLSGTHPAAQGITPQELPELPASLAAHYLGCTPKHLDTIVERWPEYLQPITDKGSKKYHTAQLLIIKQKALTYRKP